MEHHFARENHRAGIDFILIRILRRGAVGRFENGVTSDVVYVSTGRDADPAHLRRKRVAQIITVQIQRRDDVEIFRSREDLLQGDVRNCVFDDNAGARLLHRDFAPGSAIDFFGAEILLRDFITPITERAFGELHDVALVDQRYAFALVHNRVRDRTIDEAHTARATHRFDADPYANIVAFRCADFFPEIRRFLLRAETNFVELLWKFLLKEIENLLRLWCACRVLDARVDVFGIFPEDHHVHFLRVLDGRGDTFEILHRSQANEKIETLSQRNGKRTHAAAYRRCQRTFDTDEKFTKCFNRIIG